MAPREGFAAPELHAMLESAEISRTTMYEALKWGVGQGYLHVGGTERKSRWVPGKLRPPWLPSDD